MWLLYALIPSLTISYIPSLTQIRRDAAPSAWAPAKVGKAIDTNHPKSSSFKQKESILGMAGTPQPRPADHFASQLQAAKPPTSMTAELSIQLKYPEGCTITAYKQ